MFRMIVLSSFMVIANIGFADAGQQQQQQQQKQGAQQQQQQQQKQQRAHQQQQQQQGQQKQQGVQGQTAEAQVDADAAYACLDGRWPVQGFCRDRFLGVVTDCYNVIGYGLRSNQCSQLGGYAGYPVQILDGRGYTYCDCYGAVY